MSHQLDDLYLPDGKRLGVQLYGQPGSGKSYFIEHTLKAFMKKNQDENLRVIYVSPKHETILDKEPIYDLAKIEKHLKKNRMAVFYPSPNFYEQDVDELIDLIFDIREFNEDFKATILIDDAQVFLGSRASATPSHKRLVLTGRSKKIRVVYVSHALVMHKLLEGQMSFLISFTNPLPLEYRNAIQRFGYDPQPFEESMKETEYAYVWFNTRTREGRLHPPLEI
tara:strand:- start:657 stop:1328 length:672 start_codon:yes stop_codon:yes gene_type:complete